MADLKTTFAGLHLKNPIIISSSGLTDSAEKNRKLEDAGAGAIVLKSLFEEQIMLEAEQMQSSVYYPEGGDYLIEHLRSRNLSEYLSLIQESKKLCSIPIIASINCFSDAEWTDFAHKIELAGADAIEINVLAVQTSAYYECGEFEQQHIKILKNVRNRVNIPVIMKLGMNFTNPVALITQLKANGASAVVLFNRFYQPDIDINKLKYTSGEVFSAKSDLSNSIRWIGISSAAVPKLDYAASGGVHTHEAAIKAILAGSSAVEICSTIYKNGSKYIQPMLQNIEVWMNDKGYESISQFKGTLNAKDVRGFNTFERTQFLKYFEEKN